MERYRVLNKQIHQIDNYKIIPIRFEDRMNIMNWRNEQLDHLRQSRVLTMEDQDDYFDKIIAPLFEDDKPDQLLFSYLKDGICIGYGGLVHINWEDKNAEISFLIDTKLEMNHFEFHWSNFLNLIERIAFQELNLYKIYTFAFDVRPLLYEVLEKSNYQKDAILKEHCYFKDEFINVIIHAKTNKYFLFYRKANVDDLDIYYKWLLDSEVRAQSFNSESISYKSHSEWFKEKINDDNTILLIFQNLEKKDVGQVRIQKMESNKALIGVSIDKDYRGKRYASKALSIASKYFLDLYPDFVIQAYIKKENKASEKAFINAGFKSKGIVEYKNQDSFYYTKKIK